MTALRDMMTTNNDTDTGGNKFAQLEAADIAVVVLYFVFVLGVGIWVSHPEDHAFVLFLV